MMSSGNAFGRKPAAKEPDYTVKDPKAIEINGELARLKERCKSEQLGPETTLDTLMAHAASKLEEPPDLAKTHRFSWISGLIEIRLTAGKES